MNQRLALSWLFGPYAALLVLGMQAVSFSSGGHPWLGEGMLTVETGAIALPIVGGIVCAAAGVDASRVGRSMGYHPVGTARKGARAYVWAALWTAIPACISQVLVIVAALIIGKTGEISVSWFSLLLAVAVQCAAIVWFAALGSALGRHIQPVIAGVLGAAVGYLTIFVASTEANESNPLDFGGAHLSLIGFDYNWRNLLLQFAIFVLTAVVFLLVSPRTAPTVSLHHTGRLVCVAAVAVALFVGVGRVSNLPRMVEHRAAPTVCTGSDPEICTYPEQRHDRPEIVTWIQRLTHDARSAGYASLAPRRFEMATPGHKPMPPAWGILIPDDGVESSYEAWAAALVTPTHCPQVSGMQVPAQRYFQDMDKLVATWTALGSHRRAPLSPAQVAAILHRFDQCQIPLDR